MSAHIRTSRQAALQQWLVRSALMVLAVIAATLVAPVLNGQTAKNTSNGSSLQLSALK